VNLVQVFDLSNLGASPQVIPILGEDPRAMAVSPDGSSVYVAVFESGNGSTILGGGIVANAGALAFPPNVVSDPLGPYGGMNPPPNLGSGFFPALTVGLPAPIPVGLIVKKNATGRWMDDNGGDWTNLVSGPQASRSGRIPGWNLPDRDLARIDANTLSLSYATRLMNMCMAVGVNPATGAITVVGTDATNEIRYEPNLSGRFVRVHAASVNPATLASTVTDLNPHLSYATSTIPQDQRNQAIGDPRAVVWTSAGTTAYVAGMGSNNVIVLDSTGTRASQPPIAVGEGPTGLALDESRDRLYVLNRFSGSVSIVNLSTSTEVGRLDLFDPTPTVIKVGRKHLYDTHKTSGLGQVACASCHVDARIDRLAWDLGDPSGTMQSLGSNNLGMNLPGLAPGSAPIPFSNFHPMKGPMTTQTFQDIIGKEPLHWRGDRAGLEAFNPAFIGLQGDDSNLTPVEMAEFENFLATITFPPNPFRTFTNGLPTSLPLTGQLRTGRFGSAGQPMPNGNAVNGLALYRSSSRRLDGGALACVTCHTLPTGAGADYRFNGSSYSLIAPGPMGERHLALVSVDGSSNTAIKTPQIRNAYEKTGFNCQQLENTAGFGYIHDGSVDTLARFISEPAFNVVNDQEVADITAFVLAISGSDLPQGSTTNPFEPPGVPSKDTHAAVGTQTTVVSQASAPAAQLALINSMISLANSNRVGLVVKGTLNGEPRGWALTTANTFSGDRQGQTISAAALLALASPGSELTYTVVPEGSEVRIGIDRNVDGCLNGDERLGLCGSRPSCPADLTDDGGVDGDDVIAFFASWDQSEMDYDFSGGTDGDDVIAFFADWDTGC
jgi:DNA-binding beta-propeller fold protein YncE